MLPMQEREPRTAFGRAVRDARKSAKLSQLALANRVQVAPSTIYRIEYGHPPAPSVETRLRRWARTKDVALPEVDALPADDADDEPAARTGTTG